MALPGGHTRESLMSDPRSEPPVGTVEGRAVLWKVSLRLLPFLFLLCVAEAGFFPGIILYLSYWYSARERARAVALFMTASPVAGALGSPLSGALLQYLNGTAGLAGWQWLFLVEGLPSVVLGVCA